MRLLLMVTTIIGSAALAIPLAQPAWREYQLLQRDCVETPPPRRTEVQRKRCKPQPRVTLIVPGVF